MNDMSRVSIPQQTRLLRLISTPEANACPTNSARIFQIDASFESAGTWAGVKQLVEAAYVSLQERGEHAIIQQHDYELYMALPKHRHCIHPRYLCLTDSAVAIEKTRFYPLERAYRIVHGLVGLILEWKCSLPDQGHWLVIVRNFDLAQHLATRFFAELARRAAACHAIDVIVETASTEVSPAPGIRSILAAPSLDTVAPAAITLSGPTTLEPEAELEEHYPQHLRHARLTGNDFAAAELAFKVMQLYNRRGYYHEARTFIDTILPHFDRLVGNEEFRRINGVSEMNSCLVATGDAGRARQIIADHAVPHITKPHLLANMHYMLAMHHLRYLEAKDMQRAEFHILQAVDLIRAAKQGPDDHEHAFLTAFIDNGLAFLRVRQKRERDALQLCESAYKSVTTALGEGRHLLHRSVLQYNMAQVYVIQGRLEAGLACYDNAIAMDPFYTEYQLESGNILLQLERYRDAIKYYTRAIEYSPPYPEVYFAKAVCHAHLEQWSEALACSAISLELNPNQPDLYAARADIFAEHGQPDAAIAEYDKAVAVAPDSIAMRVNRAVLHFNNDAYDLALADMDHVVALEPEEAGHYENRAAIYQAIDRQDLYLQDLGRAERCGKAA